MDVSVGRDLPGTLYMPTPAKDSGQRGLIDPGNKPPIVVLGHGYSADRAGMSSIARSLATAGYAVLAIDFRGHGANRNAFNSGTLHDDLDTAVDWIEDSSQVDSQRVVIMGHSMGADATLDFASADPRPSAVVAISGGSNPGETAERPANAFFIVAEDDSGSIREASRAYASELAGTQVRPDRTYGALKKGSGVRYSEIGGTNHITILWSGNAIGEIVSWLDEVFSANRSQPSGLVDPRLGPAGLYLLCALILLMGVGLLCGRSAPGPQDILASRYPGSLLVISLGLGAAMLPLALGSPFGFLMVGFGDVVTYLVYSGLALISLRALRRRGFLSRLPAEWFGSDRRLWSGALSLVGPSTFAVAAAYALFAPLGIVVHRLVPTPDRAMMGVITAVLLLPFFIAFHGILRNGDLLTATLRSVGGHGLLLAALLVGVLGGLLPGIVGVVLPILAGAFALAEIFAIGAYALSRNALLVATVETAWIAGMAALTMPMG